MGGWCSRSFFHYFFFFIGFPCLFEVLLRPCTLSAAPGCSTLYDDNCGRRASDTGKSNPLFELQIKADETTSSHRYCGMVLSTFDQYFCMLMHHPRSRTFPFSSLLTAPAPVRYPLRLHLSQRLLTIIKTPIHFPIHILILSCQRITLYIALTPHPPKAISTPTHPRTRLAILCSLCCLVQQTTDYCDSIISVVFRCLPVSLWR